ncbi:MAG: OmpA family protein [Acidobacteriota bacterium]
MKHRHMRNSKGGYAVLLTFVALFLPAVAMAGPQQQEAPDGGVIKRSVKAVGYRVGGGTTKVDLRGTGPLPQAKGEAKVEAQTGVTNIEASVKGLAQPGKLANEFLTYVLWAVSPDGRTINLGEIQINKGGQGKLKATTQLQTFSLFVTAEPYFAVAHPSELLVLENDTRKSTKGKIFVIDDYKLLERRQYEKLGNPLALTMDLKNVPLEMYEARNSVEIAKSHGADKYAPEIFTKAESSLKMAENLLASKAGKKKIISAAKQTVQFSEDARALAVKRLEAQRVEQERQAAAAKAKAEAEAKAAAAAAEARRRADQEAQRQAELAAARQAELKAKEEAAKAEAERARRVAEALRAQLLDQLNSVLQTRDTPRGLVVTMAGVLFDTGKYNLRPAARERLARLSGIISSHPGLVLQVEGYTDSTGCDEFNQKLSEQRAETTRSFLIAQGVNESTITAKGFGKANPIADNSTAEGRQKNRRVEIIVSGEVIGAKIGKLTLGHGSCGRARLMCRPGGSRLFPDKGVWRPAGYREDPGYGTPKIHQPKLSSRRHGPSRWHQFQCFFPQCDGRGVAVL